MESINPANRWLDNEWSRRPDSAIMVRMTDPIDVLEHYFAEIPQPEHRTDAEVAGMGCWSFPGREAFNNAVVVPSGFAPDDVDLAAGAVARFFSEQEKSFIWFMPGRISKEFAQAVQRTGAVLSHTCHGMVGDTAALAQLDAVTPEGFRIEERGRESFEEFVSLFERCFEWGRQAAENTLLGFNFNPGIEARSYLVFAPDGQAIGFGNFARIGSAPEMAYLGGSGILEEYRGRGLYKAMVRARAETAAKDGITNFLVDAMTHSSAPKLASWGFRKIRETETYVTML